MSEPSVPIRPEATDKRPGGKRGASRASRHSVTLESVAHVAGVSAITVSRALNHPDQVAAATLERVTQAIAQTGYVPNLLAGGLASNRSRLIAAIVPTIANLVYAETIQHFSQHVRNAGYQVLLGESGYLQDTEERLVSAILSRRPDAIFLTGINHSADCRRRLLAARIPIVETWDVTPTPLDIGFFRSDGMLAEIYALHPFDEKTVSSRGSELRFALEMNQGWYQANGVKPGAQLDLKALAAALKARGFTPAKYGL